MTMSTCITIPPIKKQNVSVTPENFLTAPSSQFPPTPDKGNHCFDFYHHELVLSVPELHVNKSFRKYRFFSGFFSPHSLFCFWDSVACISISFFFIVEYYSLFHYHTTCHSLLMSSWVDSSLGLLWIKLLQIFSYEFFIDICFHFSCVKI